MGNENPMGSWDPLFGANASSLTNEESSQGRSAYDSYPTTMGHQRILPIHTSVAPDPSHRHAISPNRTGYASNSHSSTLGRRDARRLQPHTEFNNSTPIDVQTSSASKQHAKIRCPEPCDHAPFLSANEFRKHYIADHEQPRQYICTHCKFKTFRSETFKKHHSQRHGGCREHPECIRIVENLTDVDHGPRKCFDQDCSKIHETVETLLDCWVNHCKQVI